MTVLLLTATLLSLAPIEQSQAQIVINVYPSQDNPTNQTLWIFSGSSSTSYGGTSSIRSSGNYNTRDTAAIVSNNGDLYNANRPSNQLLTLSPLFSSSNSKDIASVNARIPGGGKTNITFLASATNTPTITIAGRGSRTIARLFMSENATSEFINPNLFYYDGLGIRIQSPNLLYGSGESSSWVGAGVIDKPIGDFFTGTFNPRSGTTFGTMRVVVNSQVIPEPEEYALVFGLFALGFVILRRHFQKKKRQQSAAS